MTQSQAKPAAIRHALTNRRADDFAAWYQEVIAEAEMAEESGVRGCMVIRPWGYGIWERIQALMDAEIKAAGVENCYFPLFIPLSYFAKEAQHVEGFAKEMAVVTHHRLIAGADGGLVPDPEARLEEPLIVRPTSETVIGAAMARWVQSWRDLPLLTNQWANVVRWEMRTRMFLRTSEFLWQEGHTAHLTKEGAAEEVLQALDFYAATYQELLAVPVVKGTKTDNEKFAGADYTTTIEAFIPEVGRGIQAGTSHCLGQHFSKMFKITVEDPTAPPGEKKDPINVWQNSWGFTTRSIGVMIMVHSDNKGLFLPPRVAEFQVVVIPVGLSAKATEEARTKLMDEVVAIETVLKAANVRVHVDDRDNYNVGYKFNDWEQKGVPLRLEFGPNDALKHVVTVVRRDGEAKQAIPIPEIGTEIPAILEQIQADMFKRADDIYRAHRVQVERWEDFVPTLNGKNVCLIKHCLGGPCEDEIKDMSKRTYSAQSGEAEDSKAPSMGAKSLCIPFEQPSEIEGQNLTCTNPNCKNVAKKWVLFGRSY